MLNQFGWSDALQQQFTPYAADGLIPARVVVQQRGLYDVVTELGELSATLTGRLAYESEDGAYPVAGDWVAVEARPNEGTATIHHVLPRSSSRKPGTISADLTKAVKPSTSTCWAPRGARRARLATACRACPRIT